MPDFNVQPVNYGALIGQAQSLVPDPIEQQTQLTQLHNSQIAGQQVQQQMAMQRYQLQRQQSFGSDLGNYIKNPTAPGLAELFGKYPEYEQQAAAARGALDRGDVTELGSAAALAAKGNYSEAAKVIQGRVDAETAAGTDPAKIAQSKHVLNLLNSGDPQQQKGALGLLSLGVGIAVGPEKAAEFLKANGLSSEPIDVAMDHRLVTASGQPIVGANPKLESVTTTNPDGSSTAHAFNPYSGKFGAGAVDGSGAPVSSTEAGGGGPVSGSAGGAGVSPAAASVASTLAGSGFSAPVVAGFMGNFHAEGGYNGAQGDGGSASGIGQWRGERAANFEKVIGKPVTEATPVDQAKFVAWEMQNPQAAGMTVKQRNAILAAKNPAQAAALIDQFYERSSGRDRNVRMAAATAFANGGAQNASGPSGAQNASAAIAPNAQGGAAPPQQAQANPYEVGGETTGALNTKGAEPGHAWNATHTGQIAVPGTDADPNTYASEVEDAAHMWLLTGQYITGSGGGMGGGGQLTLGEKNAISKRGLALWKAAGGTEGSLQAMRSQYAGLNSSLQTAQQSWSALATTQESLEADANRLLTAHRLLAPKAPNNPDGMGIISDAGTVGRGPGGIGLSVTYQNRQALNFYEKHGTPAQQAAVRQYRAALQAYSTTYTKAMTAGSSGNSGVAAPSDSAADKSEELNDEGMGPTALRAHLQMVNAEAGQKPQSALRQIQILKNQISSLIPAGAKVGTANPSPSTAPSHPVNIPQGAVQMLKANPSLSGAFDAKYGKGASAHVLGGH